MKAILILCAWPGLAVGGDAAAGKGGQHVTIQLKWHHQFQFAGYYAAEAQGYYAREGLAVTILEGSAGRAPIQEVLAGRAEFGVSDADVLLAYLQGKPVVALGAVFQHSPYILMTRADSGVRTPSDLRGKTIMLEEEQGIVQMKAMFRREGIPLSAVNVVRHTWDLQDLIDRKVDAISAYSTVEPYQMRRRGVEPGIIRAMDYGIDFYGDTLFTTRQQVERHPDRVAAFRRASFKGWEYAMAHPGEMIELILKMPGVQERGITRELLEFEAAGMRDLVLPDLVDIGHMNPGRWETIARIYADIGVIPKAPDSVAGFVYDPSGAARSPRWLVPAAITVGAAGLGTIWVLLWNLQLKRMVAYRTAELAVAKGAAEQASHAKDHFLAVLSHELRTPLTPVVTAVSMLRNNAALDEEGRECVNMIHRNVEMEARLIDDLLDVTRIARGKVELDRRPIPIGQVIRGAVEVVQPDIEARRLHFGVDMPDCEYMVDADATRLQQVFWNLLRNAIKFTPHGGCVGVQCRLESGGHVAVEVRDSGEGIEPEALARIFNAFEQAERSITRQFGGLGLGLTISKALVELHGGTIEAQSGGKGKGATFRVVLPIISAKPQAAPRPAAPSPVRRPLRILLVEDHGDTARMIRQLLMLDGHVVDRAGDVATALELMSQQSFDLLISDLGLPDRSGLDLMRELRGRGCGIPGIALSGYGQEEDIRRSREAGFAAHLTKPTSPDRLAEVIASLAETD